MTIHIGKVMTGPKSYVSVDVMKHSTGAVFALLTANDGKGNNTETVVLDSGEFAKFQGLIAQAQRRASELVASR